MCSDWVDRTQILLLLFLRLPITRQRADKTSILRKGHITVGAENELFRRARTKGGKVLDDLVLKCTQRGGKVAEDWLYVVHKLGMSTSNLDG